MSRHEEPALRLALSHIRHTYPGADRAAVDDVSFSVAEQEVVCLLGPSGCGKSTLLRIAAGLEAQQAGVVRMRGQVIADPAAGIWTPPERRAVGLVFQDSALFPHLTVLQNVSFGLDRLRPAERRAHARHLLGQLHMAEYADAFPHMLSGGQQQRVALARALAPAPVLMLLDEPFSSLDARLRDQIRDDTLHILKASATGTLMVTHDPEEAMFMADRIVLMRDGQVVQAGTPEALYCRPVDPFVVRFFGAVNTLQGVVDAGGVVTPAGTVGAGPFPAGTRVIVLMRPEALLITHVHSGPAQAGQCQVEASRLLGRVSLIHLRATDATGHPLHLHARVPGVFLPTPGQAVELALDPAQVFVFAI